MEVRCDNGIANEAEVDVVIDLGQVLLKTPLRVCRRSVLGMDHDPVAEIADQRVHQTRNCMDDGLSGDPNCEIRGNLGGSRTDDGNHRRKPVDPNLVDEVNHCGTRCECHRVRVTTRLSPGIIDRHWDSPVGGHVINAPSRGAQLVRQHRSGRLGPGEHNSSARGRRRREDLDKSFCN